MCACFYAVCDKLSVCQCKVNYVTVKLKQGSDAERVEMGLNKKIDSGKQQNGELMLYAALW